MGLSSELLGLRTSFQEAELPVIRIECMTEEEAASIQARHGEDDDYSEDELLPAVDLSGLSATQASSLSILGTNDDDEEIVVLGDDGDDDHSNDPGRAENGLEYDADGYRLARHMPSNSPGFRAAPMTPALARAG